MTSITRTLNTPWGRGARILVGLELAGAAIQAVGGAAGAALAAVGILLLLSGLRGRSSVRSRSFAGVTAPDTSAR